MAVNQSVRSSRDDRMLTLQDLRDLVEATQHLDGTGYVLRGRPIPFKMADIGDERGQSMTDLTVTED